MPKITRAEVTFERTVNDGNYNSRKAGAVIGYAFEPNEDVDPDQALVDLETYAKNSVARSLEQQKAEMEAAKSAAAPEPAKEAAKPKRKRRTKAEIEADKAAEEAAQNEAQAAADEEFRLDDEPEQNIKANPEDRQDPDEQEIDFGDDEPVEEIPVADLNKAANAAVNRIVDKSGVQRAKAGEQVKDIIAQHRKDGKRGNIVDVPVEKRSDLLAALEAAE
jgi:hypothetical protein